MKHHIFLGCSLGLIGFVALAGCTSAPSIPSVSDANSSSFSSLTANQLVTISWKFDPTTVENAQPDTPFTEAHLILTGAKTADIDLGKYMGSGVDTHSIPGQNETGSLLGATFWFAGGGDELAIDQESGSLIVRHRDLDETSGKGPWKAIQTVPLDSGMTVRAAAYVEPTK